MNAVACMVRSIGVALSISQRLIIPAEVLRFSQIVPRACDSSCLSTYHIHTYSKSVSGVAGRLVIGCKRTADCSTSLWIT